MSGEKPQELPQHPVVDSKGNDTGAIVEMNGLPDGSVTIEQAGQAAGATLLNHLKDNVEPHE